MIDEDKRNRVYKIVQEFKKDCDPMFIKVIDAYCDIKNYDDGEFPQYEIDVIIEDGSGYEDNTYCYPVAEFGRERGLFLFDTVSNWQENKVTLRFGME